MLQEERQHREALKREFRDREYQHQTEVEGLKTRQELAVKSLRFLTKKTRKVVVKIPCDIVTYLTWNEDLVKNLVLNVNLLVVIRVILHKLK